MKKYGVIGASVLALSVMLGANSADAVRPGTDPECYDLVYADSCDAELADLCAAIEASDSLNERDEDTMVSKVLGAAEKINQGKIDDADAKLGDIESKLYQLTTAPKQKISETDADAITYALLAAQSCVDGL